MEKNEFANPREGKRIVGIILEGFRSRAMEPGARLASSWSILHVKKELRAKRRNKSFCHDGHFI